MAVTVYRSTDASAPVLSGTTGALVNLLEKCLVTGYGSKAAAGWTKPYTGTNAAVFRMGGGNQFYLDVNDNGPGIGGAMEARVFGYEAMSAVATGTGQFPTSLQRPAGIVVRKSATADATARVWTLIADDRTLYLLIKAEGTTLWLCTCFGDFYSYLAGTDNFRTMIIGRITENSSSAASETADSIINGFGASTGHYAARVYTGLGGSINIGKQGDAAKGNLQSNLSGTMAVPNPVDGRIWISPTFLVDNAQMRGMMRGFMHYLHGVTTFADQDTVTGAGPYTGHTFLLFKTTGAGGAYCIDITGPWDTN